MGRIGGGQDLATSFAHERSAPMMNVGQRVVTETRVPTLSVVPEEEPVAELAGVLLRAEALGESGHVLEGLELRLAEWVLVWAVRPRVRLGHAQALSLHDPRVAADPDLARATMRAMFIGGGSAARRSSGLPHCHRAKRDRDLLLRRAVDSSVRIVRSVELHGLVSSCS